MKLSSITVLLILACGICQGRNLSKDERILNGSFESGMTEYFTDYIFTNLYLHIEGYYTLTKNPNQVYTSFADCKDHTNGEGLMAVFNGSEKHGDIVWEQTINNVDKNRIYYFSFWATSVILNSPAKLEVYINDLPLSLQPVQLPDLICDWKEYGFYWSSGLSDTAKITIKNANVEFNGNDFALDDLSFRAVCIEGEIAGQNRKVCFGESVMLGMDNPPQDKNLVWKWSPSSDISADNIPNPVFSGTTSARFYLELTDTVINCVTYDTVDIEVASKMPGVLTTDKSGIICPCDSIILSAPSGDFTYLWSTGDTQSRITVRNSGTYSLKIQNSMGCSITIDTLIEIYNSVIDLELDSVSVNTGDIATINLRISNPISKDKCVPLGYNILLRFDKSSLTPLDNKFPLTESGDYYLLEVSGTEFDNLLQTLKFAVTLGITTVLPVEIIGAGFGCKDIKISKTNGDVHLKNLCFKPEARLFKDTDELYMKLVSANQAADCFDFEFRTIEKGFAEIVFFDSMGKVVISSRAENLSPGVYTYSLETGGIADGLYFAVLKTPSINSTLKFSVIK